MKKQLLIIWGMLLLASSLKGQDGTIDPTFFTTNAGTSNGTKADDIITQVEALPSGKFIIAGFMRNYDGVRNKGIIRLLPNGLEDIQFQHPEISSGHVFGIRSDGKVIAFKNRQLALFDSLGVFVKYFSQTQVGYIAQIKVQPDNKIILAGSISDYDGKPVNNIMRLNADGSLDTAFIRKVGTGTNQDVKDLALQPDGKILLVGGFTIYNGIPVNNLVRINSDGSYDNTFQTAVGADQQVSCVAAFPDGRIFIGGIFQNFGGVSSPFLACLRKDGTLNTHFINQGFGSNVFSVVPLSGGRAAFCGYFGSYGTKRCPGLVVLDSLGAPDSHVNLGTGFNNSVTDLISLPDNSLITIGHFNGFNGFNRNYIAKIKPLGQLDPIFANPGISIQGVINNISETNNHKLLITGSFKGYGGYYRNNMAFLNQDGDIDTVYSPAGGISIFQGNTVGAYQLNNNNLFIAGTYTFDQYLAQGCAIVSPSGTFISGTSPTYNDPSYIILTSAQQPDGKILVGRMAVLATRAEIVRYLANGQPDATWTPFNVASSITAIAVLNNGKILVTTPDTSFNQTQLIRLNANGILDPGFRPNIPAVNSMLLGKIAVGNDNRIALGCYYLNTSSGTGFNGNVIIADSDGIFQANASNSINISNIVSPPIVYDLAWQPDGKLLVGGNFSVVNGTSVGNIVRLTSNYTVDGTFNIPGASGGVVNTILLDHSNRILVGGNFVNFNNQPVSGLTRLQNSIVTGLPARETINPTGAETIFAWPNPAKNEITLNVAKPSVYSLSDVTGKLILAGIYQPVGKIDLSNVGTGIYLLKINSGDAEKTVKLLVEK